MIRNEENKPKLCYKETSGQLATCIAPEDVVAVLHRFHDSHGHFASGIMSRNMLGRYYWPGRMQDIARWCVSCEACQRLGPLRNSTQVKPIMSLQPMDLLGMDFVGPINPKSKNGSVYILLAVDYFSRYLFAHATQRNTGEAVVTFLEQCIAKVFGWPLAFYVDNGSHFVKGRLPAKLQEVGTKLFTAPITNPRSVGLAERYVQLILAGLRTTIAEKNVRESRVAKVPETLAMESWDKHLDSTVHAINSRVLKVHGFSPSQLFIGFDIRLHPLDVTATEQMRASLMKTYLDDMEDGMEDQNIHEYGVRLACLEEIRELTRERVLRQQEEQVANAGMPRFQPPEVGDLVLRRRFQVDKSLGMKLYTKWDGPYRLTRIAKSGVSGDIEDLKTGRRVGRYAFEGLKVFVPREQNIGERSEEKDSLDEAKQWVALSEGLKKEEVVIRGATVYL